MCFASSSLTLFRCLYSVIPEFYVFVAGLHYPILKVYVETWMMHSVSDSAFLVITWSVHWSIALWKLLNVCHRLVIRLQAWKIEVSELWSIISCIFLLVQDFFHSFVHSKIRELVRWFCPFFFLLSHWRTTIFVDS